MEKRPEMVRPTSLSKKQKKYYYHMKNSKKKGLYKQLSTIMFKRPKLKAKIYYFKECLKIGKYTEAIERAVNRSKRRNKNYPASELEKEDMVRQNIRSNENHLLNSTQKIETLTALYHQKTNTYQSQQVLQKLETKVKELEVEEYAAAEKKLAKLQNEVEDDSLDVLTSDNDSCSDDIGDPNDVPSCSDRKPKEFYRSRSSNRNRRENYSSEERFYPERSPSYDRHEQRGEQNYRDLDDFSYRSHYNDNSFRHESHRAYSREYQNQYTHASSSSGPSFENVAYLDLLNKVNMRR